MSDQRESISEKREEYLEIRGEEVPEKRPVQSEIGSDENPGSIDSPSEEQFPPQPATRSAENSLSELNAVKEQVKEQLYDYEVSIVIPVYNEEGIITSSVEDLIAALDALGWSYEIILCENGSKDATLELAKNLSARFFQVRYCSIPEPNYGKALRRGILEARGKYVICDEIDLGDIRFYRNALAILRQDASDMVVGSKTLAGSQDNRGWVRQTATKVLNQMLRVLVGFQGTDTHGLKAFRRDRLLKIVESCVVDKDLFTSELVIRAERNNIRIREIPLQVEEKRKPSINLFKRVPNVLMNMAKLVWIFRIKGDK